MQIINKSGELSAKDIYNLTMNPTTKKMKDAVGVRIPIHNWAIYQDVAKKTGEVQEILAIATTDSEIYATNSPTFTNDFVNMWELFTGMGETVPAITVTSGKSKADRDFITCVYSD